MQTTKAPIEYRMSSIGNELNNIALFRADTPEKRRFFTKPHVVDAMTLVVCKQGTMRFRVNFKEHILERGKMLLTFPNSLIEPLHISHDLMLYSTLYDLDYVNTVPISSNYDVLYKLYNMPCVSLTEDELMNFISYFDFMYERYHAPELPNKSEVLKYLLVALCIEVRAVYAHIDDDEIMLTRQEQIVRDFFAELYTHFKTERNIAFYADKLHLTPKYLTTVVREQTGYSILEWIHQAVISSAKFLLKSGETPVQDIADELHFSDASVFCRFFKNHTNLTPNQYRHSD